MRVSQVLVAFLLALGACAQSQAQVQTETAVQPSVRTPALRGDALSSTARPVNNLHRGDSTKIDFRGTPVRNATGEARLRSKRGAAKIAVEFKGLQRPTTFGNEHLLYVMRPIPPEGRPANRGEALMYSSRRRRKRDRPEERLDLRSPMQESKTLFSTQSRVLVGQFWGGRIQISEIAGTLNMQNVILGPTGSDGLLDYHPPRPNEPYLPRSIAFNGFSLRFQLGRNAPIERRAEVWRCLAWIGGAGRRCRL